MSESYSRYERCLIATIFEHVDKKFKTQIQFAREVWPGKSDTNINTKVRAIRQKNSRGKPQGLQVEEAARMAEVLGVPLSGLALEVETKLRLGWSEDVGGGQLALVAQPLKKEVPEIEESIPARAALPSGQPGDGVQPVVGDSSAG